MFSVNHASDRWSCACHALPAAAPAAPCQTSPRAQQAAAWAVLAAAMASSAPTARRAWHLMQLPPSPPPLPSQQHPLGHCTVVPASSRRSPSCKSSPRGPCRRRRLLTLTQEQTPQASGWLLPGRTPGCVCAWQDLRMLMCLAGPPDAHVPCLLQPHALHSLARAWREVLHEHRHPPPRLVFRIP